MKPIKITRDAIAAKIVYHFELPKESFWVYFKPLENRADVELAGDIIASAEIVFHKGKESPNFIWTYTPPSHFDLEQTKGFVEKVKDFTENEMIRLCK